MALVILFLFILFPPSAPTRVYYACPENGYFQNVKNGASRMLNIRIGSLFKDGHFYRLPPTRLLHFYRMNGSVTQQFYIFEMFTPESGFQKRKKWKKKKSF